MMDEVDRTDVDVFYVTAADTQEDIRRAWDELEAAVGPLRGRKFYGTFDPTKKEYRSCVEADEDLELSYERTTLPGGKYARTKLKGEPPGLYAEIAPTVDTMIGRVDADWTRPVIEFYRSHDEVHILVPVK